VLRFEQYMFIFIQWMWTAQDYSRFHFDNFILFAFFVKAQLRASVFLALEEQEGAEVS